jgi:acylphosphatase
MKLKITITGPKVHEVGYRVFLLRRARSLGFQKFDAYNASKKGLQIVIIAVEGDENQLEAFKSVVENDEPEGAAITGRSFEDYKGLVPPISEYSQDAILEQLDKGIPALLRMDHKMAQMLEKQDQTIEEIRGLREEIQPGLAVQLRQVQGDIRAIKERLGMP